MAKRKQPNNGPWRAVATTHEGREYAGEYWTEDGDMIRVRYNIHDKCAQLHGAGALGYAQALLGELVREHPGE
jgi:hypothetical protein